ncbi:MAG: ribosomal-processing cysteine protease Prp [Erysipelotrichaceae bacterium]|nr:ribosomal-processing cysteine protease Prp [Erysipelotrichaceae bacterium]
MIRISVEKRQDSITAMEVKGHADFADFGNDVVCAAISSITYGLMNAVDEMSEASCTITDKPAHKSIEVIHDSEKLQNILQTGLIMMKTVAEVYPKNVKIKTMEVEQ